MKKHIVLAVCAIFSRVAFCQNSISFSYNGSGNYYLVERTDLRRYDNNKYTGLISREVKSFIARTSSPQNANPTDSFYDGYFYVNEQTRRAFTEIGEGIHDAIFSSFRITHDGQLFMIEDNGYPSFRSFPSFPQNKIKQNEKWISRAERAIDPTNKGIITKIPMDVEYTYLRDEIYHGEEVFVLSAQWATRYGISYFDFNGDKELKSAYGSHKATMYISKETGNAIVVRDSVDETFVFADGNKITFKGTISLFTEYPPAVDRSKIIPIIQRVAKISDDDAKVLAKPTTSIKPTEISKIATSKKSVVSEDNITVENTDSGIRLTMQNLQFKANSAELLAEETTRLDQIASILKQANQNQFLIEGHTASTGNLTGEEQLSKERAYTIAKELAKRGIASEKFICKGSGSRKPIADNSTPEGKAKNRRVEITILE